MDIQIGSDLCNKCANDISDIRGYNNDKDFLNYIIFILEKEYNKKVK
jgi:hypothetical protein